MTGPISPGAGTGPTDTGGSGAPTTHTDPGTGVAGGPIVEPAASPAAPPVAPSTGQPAGVQPASSQPAAPSAPSAQPAPAAGADGADWKVEDLPEGAQKHLKDTRDEAAAKRAAAAAADKARKEAEDKLTAVMEGLGKLVNPGQQQEPLTPEQLTAQVTELKGGNTSLKARNTQQSVLLKAWERGTAAGAEVTALMDSIQFRDSLKGLDPTATDFVSTLDQRIKEGMALDPRRFTAAAVQAAASAPSGGDFGGGPSGTPQDDSVDALLAARDAEYKRSRGL